MKKLTFIGLVCFLVSFTFSEAQINQRKEIRIPDIPGYKTLKCDFHIHTVFSDGSVWPDLRVQEAWSEGLDAIALTDHLEYQPKKNDIPSNHDRPHEIAKPAAVKAGITLIKGAEITRNMPPGHMNLIFVKDANALVKDDWKETVMEGKKQGALLFWNHPGWKSQQPDGISRWYAEHTYLEEQNMLMGIEVVNGSEYYPEVHTWCNEKKHTLMGNSDIHSPIMFDYDIQSGVHRPMTLVFAKENSEEAIKDALINRRTVVYSKNLLIGEEKYLKPIFEKSISFKNTKVKTIGKETCYLHVHNDSDVPFTLQLKTGDDRMVFPQLLTVPANKTVQFTVRASKDDVSVSESVKAEYEVKNLITAPQKGIIVGFSFDVEVTPKKK